MTVNILFKDRRDAGKKLAVLLKNYRSENPIILALPRGGVVVADEVSKTLSAPLNVIISRKIGSPLNPEFGIGAVCEETSVFLDKENIKLAELGKDEVEILIELQKEEIKRRAKIYRKGRRLPDMKEKTVILIDDGLATGVTARAAIDYLKNREVKKIIFAAPVCDIDTAKLLKKYIKSVICTGYPSLRAIGEYYENFSQVEDDEVIEILRKRKNQTPDN